MMAEKNSEDVNAKIDTIAQELKDLLAQKDEEQKKPAPKKTAAKPAAKKSTSSKSTTAKPKTAKPKQEQKPTAKKQPTKKPPQKAADKQSAEQPPETVDDDEIARAIAEAEAYAASEQAAEPAPEPAPEPEPQPAPEPSPQPEPAPEPEPAPQAEEQRKEAAEQVHADVVTQEAEKEAAATEQKPEKQKKSGSFAQKTDAALKSKKAKLPIFIVINSLFLISAILLMFASYAFSLDGGNTMTHYNIFQYYAHSDLVKEHLYLQAPGWEGGAYVMLGILMFLAMLVPLALMIKNIIIAVSKKKFDVYNADALIYFGTMLGFLALVNMFGAWLSAGQIICLIISALILAFTLLTMLITKSVKQLPFFSLVNIVIAFIALFLLTWKVYSADNRALAPAAAAHAATGGGFMFFMLLVAVAALVLLVILQMKRFRGVVGHIIEIVVPLAAAVCSLIAVICAGAATPDGLGISGGFVFGMVLTLLLAIADTLFTFLKPLKKFKVMVDDSNDGNGNNVFADAPQEQVEGAEGAEGAEEPKAGEAEAHEDQANADEPIFCPECGAKNPKDSKFCIGCGKALN